MKNIVNDSLNELMQVEIMARDFGFEWPDMQMIIEQAISECAEIRSAIEYNESKERLQEEIGDLIHTAISLCRFAGFDVEATLNKSTTKFTARMNALIAITKQRGLDNLKGQSIEFMLELWREAKEVAV